MTKYHTGDRIGKLTIVARAPGSGRTIKWEIVCACGNSYVRPTSYITRNKDKGCSRCRPKGKSHRYTGTKNISGNVWAGIIHRSKASQRRGRSTDIDFQITIEFAQELFDRQDGRCAYTNWPIGFSKWDRIDGQYTECTASLDRVDSSLGYTEDNVVWVHKIANRAKSDMPLALFLELCNAVSVNRGIQAEP